LNKMERELEIIIVREVGKHINDFAVSVDKRFPDVVTKEDFDKWADSVAMRVRDIETPDMTPLSQRLDVLENRVSEIANTFRLIAGRLPLVIE
ncbi:MAG: hypothetical protein ABIA21_02815, partial [Candidatus Aenigmatarchaeota archaeon]